MLQAFVHQMTESLRKDVDWIARFGGEEFLIVLPETEVQGAVSLTERIRSSIVQKTIDMPGKNISTTASFGLSGISPDTPNEKTTPDFLIKEADTHLYHAKTTGKTGSPGAIEDCFLPKEETRASETFSLSEIFNFEQVPVFFDLDFYFILHPNF